MQEYVGSLLIGVVSLAVCCHSFVPIKHNPIQATQTKTQSNPTNKELTQSGRRWGGNKRFSMRHQRDEEKDLDSVILSIDTGAKRIQSTGEDAEMRGSNPVYTIMKALKEFNKSPNSPIYRAQEEYNIRPKLIKFRTAEKPSLKVDLESESILKAVSDLLRAPIVRRYVDLAATKAAELYTALREELTTDETIRRYKNSYL